MITKKLNSLFSADSSMKMINFLFWLSVFIPNRHIMGLHVMVAVFSLFYQTRYKPHYSDSLWATQSIRRHCINCNDLYND